MPFSRICDQIIQSSYNPLETQFTRYAREGGLQYSNGLSMLVWQAAMAEEIWNHVKFSKEDVETVMEITRKELAKNG